MRKEKTNQKIIRRAITWVMAVLITFSSVGGNIMTVYAGVEGEEQDTTSPQESSGEEQPKTEAPSYHGADENNSTVDDNATDNSPKDYFEDKSVDNKSDQYTNVETSGAESVDELNEYAKDAKNYAVLAENAAKNAENLIGTSDVEGTYEAYAQEANAVAGEAQDANTKAENAATEAENDVTAAENSFKGAVSAYDDIVKADNEMVEKATEAFVNDTGIVDAKNATIQAKRDANTAKDQALEALKETLEADGEKRIEAAEKVVEFAKTAAEKANEANAAYTSAKNKLDDAVNTYNYWAMIYGLPVYGAEEGSLGYTDEQIAEKLTDPAFKADYDAVHNAAQAVDDAKNTIDGTQLTTTVTTTDENNGETTVEVPLTDIINSAKTEYESAKAEYDSAKAAAATAKAAATEAESQAKNAAKGVAGSILAEDEEAVATDTASGILDQAKELFSGDDNKKKELEEIESEYLNNISGIESDAAKKVLKTLQDSLRDAKIELSNEINQAEFDRALTAWAEEYTNYLLTLAQKGEYEEKNEAEAEMDALMLLQCMSLEYKGEILDSSAKLGVFFDEIEDKIGVVIETCKDSLRQKEEAEALLNIKVSTLTATAAAKRAQDVVDGATEINDIPDSTIDDAMNAVCKAQETLNTLKTTAANTMSSLSKVDLKDLLNAICTAESLVKDAEGTLQAANWAKSKAEQYADYAVGYASYEGVIYGADGTLGSIPTATAFARVKAELNEEGKIVPVKDENGNFIFLSEQNDYDLSDKEVVSRPKPAFTNISDLKEMVIREEDYKAFVSAVVAYVSTKKQEGISGNTGTGIATSVEKGEGSMQITYWLLDEETGKPTGEWYTDTTTMPSGKYFVPYTMKTEGDLSTVGYHYDGVIVDFVQELVLLLPEVPAGEGNPGGGNPGGRAASPAGDVLGAKREDIAMVAEEGDVLGATRAPKTSDSAKAILWMLVMGSSAIGAVAAMASKRKEA